MIELDTLNELSKIGAIIHNTKELSNEELCKRKFLYIEGLIRFLELYACNEIGETEVDIEKVALWVNSPYFENVDIYHIKTINDVYKSLTDDLIEYNIPLYRFLKLDENKLALLEKSHRNQLLQEYIKDSEIYPCLKCIWYSMTQTDFGPLSKCRCPKEEISNNWSFSRKSYFDITNKENINCKYITTIDNVDKFIDKYLSKIKISIHKDEYVNKANKYKQELIDKINNLDNSYIPIVIPDAYSNLLSEKIDVLKDLGRLFGNKQSKTDMQLNLRRAIVLEVMIKFVEIYAQTELGNNYRADISKIAKYVYSNKFSFTSKEEIYTQIENMIYENKLNINMFCKVELL